MSGLTSYGRVDDGGASGIAEIFDLLSGKFDLLSPIGFAAKVEELVAAYWRYCKTHKALFKISIIDIENAITAGRLLQEYIDAKMQEARLPSEMRDQRAVVLWGCGNLFLIRHPLKDARPDEWKVWNDRIAAAKNSGDTQALRNAREAMGMLGAQHALGGIFGEDIRHVFAKAGAVPPAPQPVAKGYCEVRINGELKYMEAGGRSTVNGMLKHNTAVVSLESKGGSSQIGTLANGLRQDSLDYGLYQAKLMQQTNMQHHSDPAIALKGKLRAEAGQAMLSANKDSRYFHMTVRTDDTGTEISKIV